MPTYSQHELFYVSNKKSFNGCVIKNANTSELEF